LGVLGRLRHKGLFALGVSALLLGYLVPTAKAVSGPGLAVPAGHQRLVASSLADGAASASPAGRDILNATILDSTGVSVRAGGISLQRRVLSTDLVDALTELGLAPPDSTWATAAPLAPVPEASVSPTPRSKIRTRIVAGSTGTNHDTLVRWGNSAWRSIAGPSAASK